MYWYELFSVEPTSNTEVRSEQLWQNKFILIGDKPAFLKQWQNKGIWKINDLIKADGKFKTIYELNDEFNTRLNVMHFNSLKSAIPLNWKQMISHIDTDINEQTELKVKVANIYKSINTLLCRDIYWEMTQKQKIRPTALEKWEETYYYGNFEWEYIFSLPYRVCRETYLQSLLFQIVNRYFPCATYIHTWYPHESPNCKHCNINDSLEHYFAECKKVIPFWNWLRAWMNNIYNCNIMYSTLDVIFGIPNLNNIDMFSVMKFLYTSGQTLHS
jgi:hypothetical protein